MPPTTTNQPATNERAAREGERPAWEKSSYTRRREFAEHVGDATRHATRLRRIEKSIRLLAAGKKEPK